MIQLTPQMRILVALEPADFRRGIDGLASVCKQTLREDPFSGCVFVFRNRRATALKVLVYDGQGFWLCQASFQRTLSLVADQRRCQRGRAEIGGAPAARSSLGGQSLPDPGRSGLAAGESKILKKTCRGSCVPGVPVLLCGP